MAAAKRGGAGRKPAAGAAKTCMAAEMGTAAAAAAGKVAVAAATATGSAATATAAAWGRGGGEHAAAMVAPVNLVDGWVRGLLRG